MTQVQVNTINTETNATDTGDTNWHEIAAIPSSSIDASEYIVFVNALVGGNNTTANFNFSMFESTGGIFNSFARFEMPSGYTTTGYGQTYSTLWKYDFSGSGNFNVKQQLNSTTTDTVHSTRTQMLMIKVDDTDTATDALWSGDYEMSQKSTKTESVLNTWTNLQSVTIGNGSDDYLIITSARFGTGSFSAAIDYELVVGGVSEESLTRKREATEAIYSDCIMTFLAAPATDTVVQHRYRTNTEVSDCASDAIVAIRLNAFDDYAGIHDTTDIPITVADTDTVGATLTHTTDHTSASTEDWFFIGWSQIQNNSNSKKYEDWLDQGGVNIAGAHNTNTWHFTWDDSSPYSTGGHCLYAERNMADATDVDVEFGQQEEGGFEPDPVIQTTNIVGFTLEKASGPPPATGNLMSLMMHEGHLNG